MVYGGYVLIFYKKSKDLKMGRLKNRLNLYLTKVSKSKGYKIGLLSKDISENVKNEHFNELSEKSFRKSESKPRLSVN